VNRFSVVIPALNEEKFLPRLLRSLAAQTRRDFDVVVVDGSSQDRTVDVARSFGPQLPGLNVIVSPKRGVALQRNLGARASRQDHSGPAAAGEWLVFLDADSQVQPYFMERIEAFVAEAQPRLFTSWFRPDSDRASDALFALLANMMVEGSIVAHRSLAPGPLTVVRRDAFELVNGYDETITFGEDYDLSERLTARGVEMQILRETLYVLSLRRVRKDGKLRTVGFYGYTGMQVLLTRRNPAKVPHYVMGGQEFADDSARLRERSSRRNFARTQTARRLP
jgi:glycosyltransferase involved in cell wall biosynthesis